MEDPCTEKEVGHQRNPEKSGSGGKLKVMVDENINSCTSETAPDLAHMLVDLMISSAKMAETCGTTFQQSEDALQCTVDAVSQARAAMSTSNLLLCSIQMMAKQLLKLTPYSDFREVFSCIPHLPVDYDTFQRLMNITTHDGASISGLQPDKTLLTKTERLHRCNTCHSLYPVTEDSKDSPEFSSADLSHKSACHKISCSKVDDDVTDEVEGRPRKEMFGKSTSYHKQNNDSTDEEKEKPRKERLRRSSSHHKQVDVVRKEEHMGGAYVTHRRRSPLRSPFGNIEGLSPLVSDIKVSTPKPTSCSPSSQGTVKYINKLIHHNISHEALENDTEHLED
ncbi:uncharacterized protein LOC122813803 [Protopterus annectens]|uniref:uncharacterized protein LOC122813803 n=1 Tax=Protopterus annectens TaxID=7888 RepID=UPI001CF96163|nr:uncharacterized protein LOC122813803 [Protopterus annectens]XP_043942260.1 uncharacterized protein LOC122813803 [Protopterus annectens]XP_043942261.1 uncharacterized protein LOC122813803 [Protopterus annectens]